MSNNDMDINLIPYIDGKRLVKKNIKQAYEDMIELVYGGNTSIQYSGRGIVVCEEWKNSLMKFSEDMGEMPKGALLLTKDKNKGFNKSNCFWFVIKLHKIKDKKIIKTEQQ